MSIKQKKTTILTLRGQKRKKIKTVLVTAYDVGQATLADQAGVDIILVGDSLGMTTLGHETTIPVTMDDMIRHTEAVRRGTNRAFLVGDMPYLSYQVSDEEAIRNAGRFVQAGVDCVKLCKKNSTPSKAKEKTTPTFLPYIKKTIQSGIGKKAPKICEIIGTPARRIEKKLKKISFSKAFKPSPF